MLVWNSLIRGKYVANDGLTAHDDNTLEHSKHSYSEEFNTLITPTSEVSSYTVLEDINTPANQSESQFRLY